MKPRPKDRLQGFVVWLGGVIFIIILMVIFISAVITIAQWCESR